MPGTRRSRVSLPSRRSAATATVLALLIAALVTGALSWHFSSAVVVPDHSPWSEEVTIVAVEPNRIIFEREESTERPGYYGLVWEAGHAVVGPVQKASDEHVTRRLTGVRGYLAPGTEAGLDSDVFAGDPRQARGLPYRSVPVRGELGKMPAWLIPPVGRGPAAESGTWAILVHGINGDPQVGLRMAPALRRAGLTSLLITYRDDLGAPQSPDGLHHMGQTEWRDLEAAARLAFRRGARRIVPVGYSMGGAIVSQFMQRSSLADRVSALVLDAPALDWAGILEFNATQMGFPAFASLPVRWAIGARIDVDWDSLDAVEHRRDFQLPILLFHGRDDSVVPIGASEDFAEALPRWTTFYPVPGADHVQAWNVDPRLYEGRLRRFLDEALASPPAGLTDG